MMKYIKIITGITLASVLPIACALTSSQADEKTPMGNNPIHHTNSGFKNHPFVETASSKGSFFYLRRFWESVFTPEIPDGHTLSEKESVQLLNSISGDRITWLGHASFLIKIGKVTILTDPFLTEFASPVSWAGPRRFVEPGISLDKLPPIDIVIVSHNHYDHLDDETINQLKNKENIQIIVPLGLKQFFTDRGYKKIAELDWEESITTGGLELTSLPSVHDSARTTNDNNKTLWANWAIASSSKRVLFIGDTGYSETIYKKIGVKHGPFDYAILPIGAYEPRKLMWMSHITPEEAVAIGTEVKATKLIASHWGTVSSLSDEPPWEPPKRFKKSGIINGFTEKTQWVMKVGETRPL